MSEQDRFPTAPGDECSNTSLSPVDHGQSRRKRCAQCGKPFGLIRFRRAGMQFCSQGCMDKQAEAVREAIGAKAQ